MTGPVPPNSDPLSEDPDDLRLVAFLKANQQPVPAPHPDAETKLMQAIAQTQAQRPTLRIKRTWVIAAIAFISALLGSIIWQLRPNNSGVLAQRDLELEAFMLEIGRTVSDSNDSFPELEWIAPPAPISQFEPSSKPLAYKPRPQESQP